MLQNLRDECNVEVGHGLAVSSVYFENLLRNLFGLLFSNSLTMKLHFIYILFLCFMYYFANKQ